MLFKVCVVIISFVILLTIPIISVEATEIIMGQQAGRTPSNPADGVRIFRLPSGVAITNFRNDAVAAHLGPFPANTTMWLLRGDTGLLTQIPITFGHTSHNISLSSPIIAPPNSFVLVGSVGQNVILTANNIQLVEVTHDARPFMVNDPINGPILLDAQPPIGPISEAWLNDVPVLQWVNGSIQIRAFSTINQTVTAFNPQGDSVPVVFVNGLANLNRNNGMLANFTDIVFIPSLNLYLRFRTDSSIPSQPQGQLNTPLDGHSQTSTTVQVAGSVVIPAGGQGRIRIEHPSSNSFRDVPITPHLGMFNNAITLLSFGEYHVLLQVNTGTDWMTIDRHVINILGSEQIPPMPVDPTLPPDRDQFSDNILGEMQHMIATISFWLTYPFRVIAALGQQIVEIISSAYIDGVGTLATMMQIFYLVMPEPIGNAIVLLINVTVLVAVIRMVRG